jgi:hypothetical protein
MQPLALLGFAISQPNLRLFIADIWGELNIALRTPIEGITVTHHPSLNISVGYAVALAEPCRRLYPPYFNIIHPKRLLAFLEPYPSPNLVDKSPGR